ncbi:MAG TPA: ABC transporter permease [Candidatus Saccharimonadales bacterium]|nr:ABC transporter permease [Candidatus Saccharimonadales bacterium]
MKAKHPTLLLGELRESISMALNAIAAHKLRSALTLLGVLIGVFSIIVVMTAMRVLERNIETNLSQLGGQTFAIQKWPEVQFGNRSDWEKYWRRKDITLDQVQTVEEKATLAAAVGTEGSFWGGQIQTRYAKTAPTVQMFGETPGSFLARNWTIEEGRVLVDSDVDNDRDVCVLGSALTKTVFPFGSAVGEKLKINGINYSVIGVLASKGASLGGNQDNFVVVPITTALDRYGTPWAGLTILVEARSPVVYADCEEQVREILREARKVRPGDPDDFELFSNDSLVEQFKTFTRAVRVGVAVVSSIALVAAGVGIMNIMLVSVTERTREIGVRRAVGAKRRNIMGQFIMEAVVLCEVGGVIGVLLGILGGNTLAWYMKVPPAIPVDWIVLGLLICSIVGVVFGTYPAYKAANLDPIESLRYE